ncbi:ParA family protein [Blautia sp.]|uniref:ParA family protein n=1 Tax=Blautia sp. TaxID=1955243 RepID=UPI00258D1A5E|nr:ParA family protein [Blautia sp.]
MGATIYCLCNQKGGCAKTMSSVSLGIGLAREGKKVLLADIDAQGSMTASLGYQHPDRMEVTLATVLGAVITDSPLPDGGGILHHEEGVDLLPANIELSGLEVTLVNTMSRETILRQYLQTVRDAYDVIILDCTPSLGMLTINALAAADEIIIPITPQFLSIKGLEQLIRTISKVKRQINPGLNIAGILITMADMRTNYAKDIVEILHKTYDGNMRIFESIIPLSVRAAETSAEGKSIYLHDPSGKVAAAYEALTKELVGV